MTDASFRRAQAMYDAQLPPDWDDDESPAAVARDCARGLRNRGVMDGHLVDAEEALGLTIDVSGCNDDVDEIARAIDAAAADAWEARAGEPGPEYDVPDDLYEETGRWSL